LNTSTLHYFTLTIQSPKHISKQVGQKVPELT